MDYIQILVVLSREMYNFMGMIFEVKVSFIFSLLSIFFKNTVVFESGQNLKQIFEKNT